MINQQQEKTCQAAHDNCVTCLLLTECMEDMSAEGIKALVELRPVHFVNKL